MYTILSSRCVSLFKKARKEMLGMIAGLASVGASIYGSIRAKKAAKEQHERNKELQDRANESQKKMWEETNYSDQRRHMEKAGLNPGLLYGMGGTGGATTGAGSAGSAGMENQPNMGMYDMAAAANQKKMTEAQVELAKTQADKNKAEAEKIRGVDTEESKARTIDLTQGVENKKAQEQLTRAQQQLTGLQSKIAETQGKLDEQAFGDRLREIQWTADRAYNENEIASNEAFVLEQTKWDRVEQITKATLMMNIEAALKQSDIEVNAAKIHEVTNGVMQKWAEVGQGWKRTEQEAEKIAIQEFDAQIKANYPGLFNALGRNYDDFIDNVNKLFKKPRPTHKTVK